LRPKRTSEPIPEPEWEQDCRLCQHWSPGRLRMVDGYPQGGRCYQDYVNEVIPPNMRRTFVPAVSAGCPSHRAFDSAHEKAERVRAMLALRHDSKNAKT